MGKIDFRTLTKEQRGTLGKELATALKAFGTNAEGVEFLRELLTESEQVMVGRRIQIAKRLLLNQSHPRIAKDLGVGMATVRSVDAWLRRRIDDYRFFLSSLEQKHGKDWHHSTLFLGELRRKYPSKMLLINLLLGDPFTKKRGKY